MATMDDPHEWRNVLINADAETAELIIQMQLEDIGALTPAEPQQEPDAVAGGLPDIALARNLLADELEKCRGDLPNRKLGESLGNIENGRQHVFEAAAFGWHLDDYKETIERAPVKLVLCRACNDHCPVDDTIKATCTHVYCDDCLDTLYRASMTDETLFPPRCCRQELPWDKAKHHLDTTLKGEFETKRVELRAKDRTYCHVPTCSVFINPADYVDDDAPCPNGCANTCIKCKQAAHVGECPKNEELEALLATAKLNDWQTCYDCRRMVELKIGCFHMTCICKAQFCYVCGLQWKKCRCPQWEVRRLLARAEVVVDNGEDPLGAYQDREAQIAAAAADLEANHECNHVDWSSRDYGSLQCEECDWVGRVYIMECDQCHIRLCRQCSDNRL
ncbi:hypothetical protein LTR49_017470 [Elasticomyces elasticus]|nr:hypothetical protein LTR49_017470 [Elasticomyces elasticus]